MMSLSRWQQGVRDWTVKRKRRLGALLLGFSALFLLGAVAPVPDIIVKGGTWYDVRIYDDLPAALVGIGGGNKTILIVRAETVDEVITPPANVDLWLIGGGTLTVEPGITMDLSNCTLTVFGDRTVLLGTGTIVPPKSVMKLEWFGDLDAAIALLSTNPTILSVETNIAVTNNTSVASTIGFEMIGNGRFTVAGGSTLTIAGPFNAHKGKQAFYGDGAVALSAKQELYSNWWPSFAKAVADIGANNRTLVVTDQEVVSGSLVVPATLKVKVEHGGTLEPAGATTLTLNTLEASRTRIFSGNGTINLATAALDELYLEWFGWSTSNTGAANATAFHWALDALGVSVGYIISSGPGTFAINPLTIDTRVSWIQARRGVVLTYAGSASAITVTTTSAHDTILDGLEIQMSAVNGTAIEVLDGPARWTIRNCHIEFPNDGTDAACPVSGTWEALPTAVSPAAGIKLNPEPANTLYGTIENNRIFYAHYGIYMPAGTTQHANHTMILHNQISKCRYGIYDAGGNSGQYIAHNSFDTTLLMSIWIYGTAPDPATNTIITANRFEQRCGDVWDTFSVVVDDPATMNPIRFSANTDRMTVIGNWMVPLSGDKYFLSEGAYYYFLDASAGVKVKSLQSWDGGLTLEPSAVGNPVLKMTPLASQTSDLMQTKTSGGTTVYGITKYGLPYDVRTVTPTTSGAIVLDASLSRYYYTTLTGNVTSVTVDNSMSGGELIWEVIQGVGAAHTLPADAAWTSDATPMYFTGGAAPAAPSGVPTQLRHIIRFRYNGTRWLVAADLSIGP